MSSFEPGAFDPCFDDPDIPDQCGACDQYSIPTDETDCLNPDCMATSCVECGEMVPADDEWCSACTQEASSE